MKRNLRDKGRFLVFILLVPSLILSAFFYKLALGFYAAKYTESAHGTYIRRQVPNNFGYVPGNCVHCHEQHASIGGPTAGPYDFLLFYPNNSSSQNDNFCFQCHKGGGSVQVGGIITYTYSNNFGGGTPIPTYATIYDAFNPLAVTASSHNLSDVLSHAIKRNISFTDDNNACDVCHNPHTAQQNYPVILTGKGGVKTAIRRPVDYASQNTNLWGDEDTTSGFLERMIDYSIRYQAPYYKGGLTYEPGNNNTGDGSNLPNFVVFCLNNCHTRNDVTSSERGKNLTEIKWEADGGDQHGRNSQPSGLGFTVAPYVQTGFNYVLSCTDCHEPHGSPNEWLLRTCVNGKDNIIVPGAYRWLDFCTACHTVDQHDYPWDSTTDCFRAGVCHSHGRVF